MVRRVRPSHSRVRPPKAYFARGALVVVAVGAALLVTVRAGVPPKVPVDGLPDTALGSVVLFHLERAAALLAVVGAAVLIGWRTIQGRFPRIFGPVEYEAVEAAATATADHEGRLRLLEALAGLEVPPQDADA